MFTFIMAKFRKPMALALVLLFFALSFNAYACLVPLNGGSPVGMQNGCPDAQDQPVRQICDSFKTLGIQVSPTSNQSTHFAHVLVDSPIVLVATPLSFHINFGHTAWQYPAIESPPRETSSETVVLRI